MRSFEERDWVRWRRRRFSLFPYRCKRIENNPTLPLCRVVTLPPFGAPVPESSYAPYLRLDTRRVWLLDFGVSDYLNYAAEVLAREGDSIGL